MTRNNAAVMAQRVEAKTSADDFPTPPWATRALMHHVIGGLMQRGCETVLEPCCGRGHMSKVLDEFFVQVDSADAFYYGYGHLEEFLSTEYPAGCYDWVITNPPFILGEAFILKALEIATVGVAVIVRTVFTESVGRYNRLFSVHPPSKVAQFAERVPMVKGRIDKSAVTATGYCWIVWEKGHLGPTQMVWIPPCRKELEFENDYSIPPVKDDFGHLV